MPRITWTQNTEPDQADDNAPKDRFDFMRAAAELTARGLKPDDVAAALKITRAGVRELLRDHAEYQTTARDVEPGHLTRTRRYG